MTWYFIDSGFNTGRYNMDFDLHLADICRSDEAYFRLYRWDPYCISLGAGQDISSINTEKAALDGVDIVKRPTGGRAVFHSEEITYSVVYPLEANTSARDLYFRINAALSEGLHLYHPHLAQIEMEQKQIPLGKFYKTTAGSICFAAPSKNELKFSGRKIVGSAQRKMNRVLLQHGSILCGSYHKKIISYLYLNETESLAVSKELEEKTADISSVLNQPVDYTDLCEKLAAGFECFFKIKLNRLEKLNTVSYQQ